VQGFRKSTDPLFCVRSSFAFAKAITPPAIINLGGFANLSQEQDGERMAFDICPVNVLMNRFAMMLGKRYDRGGAFAKAGKFSAKLLSQLNDLEYYHQPPPKSLGMEWVNQNVLPLIPKTADPKDVLATLCEHVAMQIARTTEPNKTALITGGGAFNDYLMRQISHYSKLQIVQADKSLIDYKEALVFALLGALRLRGEVNCLASVTGARRDCSAGVVWVSGDRG